MSNWNIDEEWTAEDEAAWNGTCENITVWTEDNIHELHEKLNSITPVPIEGLPPVFMELNVKHEWAQIITGQAKDKK